MTTPSSHWAEHALCIELFGTLQHIATRPLSKGHDGPIKLVAQRLQGLVEALASVPRCVISQPQFAVLRRLLDTAEHLPPEVIARTLIGPLGRLLEAHRNGEPDVACCYVSEPKALELERLVISVGPTIGLGDEILAARALHKRAQLVGATLHVATHHPDLWRFQTPAAHIVGLPPLGGLAFIDSLTRAERGRTGFIYADFLDTNVLPMPYCGPDGVAYAGRWSMGKRECEFLHLERRRRYRFRYPDGLPECRSMEASWMAARALPGAVTTPLTAPRSPAPASRRRILFQPLTAKPELLFAPEFYRQVFQRVVRSCADLELFLVPNPSPQGQALIRDYAEHLRSVVPTARIDRPDDVSLLNVFERVAEADLLFGPDTFTSHFAAAALLPQVTISLPQHQPWRTVQAPCLAVTAGRPEAVLIDECARAILAFLELPSMARSETSFAERARGWRASLDSLSLMVEQYLYSSAFDFNGDTHGHLETVGNGYLALSARIAQLTGVEQPAIPEIDMSVFDNREDAARALSRYYHSLELTPTAAVARAC